MLSLKGVTRDKPKNGDNAYDNSLILKIPIDAIRPNPYQPRKEFDMASLDELAQSIKQYGLLQPITVRRMGNSSYELIAGERRLRACKMINLTEIPAIVLDALEEDSAMLAMIENLQRENLNFIEEAEGYYSLLKDHNMTQEELAARIGKNQSTIANKLRLLKLPVEVKRMIVENNLTERHARALLRLPGSDLQIDALKQVIDKGLNVKKTEELVDRIVDKLCQPQSQNVSLHKGRMIRAYKDIRLFINSLKQLIGNISDSGLNVTYDQQEKDDVVEITICIAKH
ncbi:nucleoid occlusion protein [Mahella sp.]|uniref:nucleoid occlusion protein n=1 Tax=Mahella sp. TaxID=2798721 RepID=UPI0025C02ADF|nr:nucleoid occlusion protein [Mahella sp.]MBZ4665228.1 parB-like partition protein [Mahella sp.]